MTFLPGPGKLARFGARRCIIVCHNNILARADTRSERGPDKHANRTDSPRGESKFAHVQLVVLETLAQRTRTRASTAATVLTGANRPPSPQHAVARPRRPHPCRAGVALRPRVHPRGGAGGGEQHDARHLLPRRPLRRRGLREASAQVARLRRARGTRGEFSPRVLAECLLVLACMGGRYMAASTESRLHSIEYTYDYTRARDHLDPISDPRRM